MDHKIIPVILYFTIRDEKLNKRDRQLFDIRPNDGLKIWF